MRLYSLVSIVERSQLAGVTCQGLYAQVLSGERLGGYLGQSDSRRGDSSWGLATAGPHSLVDICVDYVLY